MADDLFSANEKDLPRPLADRLRPATLEDVVGQETLLGAEGALDGPLGRMIASGHLSSIILWGPPGTGKTTIARLLAGRVGLHFEAISAIFSGVAELKKVFEAARERRRIGTAKGTLLFVDEIHRFNRAQQDSFLPVMEDGTIILVGATTENPSFELNAALLSRAQVFVLARLSDEALETLLQRAEAAMEKPLPLTEEARMSLRAMADGDGRFVLNLAEELFASGHTEPLDTHGLVDAVQRRAPVYDKSREGHYNLISALHKSIRGSDCDAALYWLARMLAGGEDPAYILRRLTRFAVEDVGMADPTAVTTAIANVDRPAAPHASHRLHHRTFRPRPPVTSAVDAAMVDGAAASHVSRRREEGAKCRAHAVTELPPGTALVCCTRHGALVEGRD